MADICLGMLVDIGVHHFPLADVISYFLAKGAKRQNPSECMYFIDGLLQLFD